MSIELKKYQKNAADFISRNIRDNLWTTKKRNEYESNILKAVTGAGKTVILSEIINQVDAEEKEDYCIFWLSSLPEVNEQSRLKIEKYNSHLSNKLVTLDSSNYLNGLKPQHIYFLNYSKLSETSNMNKGGADSNNISFWDLPFNKMKIVFIIDEAHIGSSQTAQAAKANKTILNKLIEKVKPKFVVGASATPEDFKSFIEGINIQVTSNTIINYKAEIYSVPISEVCDSGMIKSELTNVSFKVQSSINNSFNVPLFLDALKKYEEICTYWEHQIKTDKRPVFLLQVEDQFENNTQDIQDMLDCLFIHNQTHYIKPKFLFHTFPNMKLKGKDSNGNNYDISSIKPNEIMENTEARIIIFKENLSTGWDCPNAEILFSMKTQHKNTAIAQTLGRILRNPFINEPHLMKKHKDVISLVDFYTPLFNQDVIEEIIKEFGIEVKTRQLNTKDSTVTLDGNVRDYFNTNLISHHDYLYVKESLDSKIRKAKEEYENNPNQFLPLDKLIGNVLVNYGKNINNAIDVQKEIEKYLSINIDRYSINITSKEVSELKHRKDAQEEKSFKAKLDFDIIKTYVENSLSEGKVVLDIFYRQWRKISGLPGSQEINDFNHFYEQNLNINDLKNVIKNIIKSYGYQINLTKDGYYILLKYLLTKHPSFLKDFEAEIDKMVAPKQNDKVRFIPVEKEDFTLDCWNHWKFNDSTIKNTNTIDQEKWNFLISEPKVGYFWYDNDNNNTKESLQPMKLNDLEQQFVQSFIVPFDFNYWWRNPSTSKGLGIPYTNSYGEDALYRPDFLAIKNNDLYILEGKVRRDEWAEKYEGLINWIKEQHSNGFKYKIHHVWCFEEGNNKTKKYYTIQNATKELIKLMEATITFADLAKTSDSNLARGIIKQLV